MQMQLYTYTTIYTHMYVCLFGFWPPWSALGTTIINFVNLSPNWKLTCIHSCLGLSGCKYRCCSPDNPQLNFKLTNIRAAAPFAVIQLTLVCVCECVLCYIFLSFLFFIIIIFQFVKWLANTRKYRAKVIFNKKLHILYAISSSTLTHAQNISVNALVALRKINI